MAHTLVWVSNRNTPKVVSTGRRYKPKPSEGRVVRTRKATASEEKTIAKNKWVRVDRKDRRPGNKNYGTGSKIRPQFKYKKKKSKSVSGRKRYIMTPARKAALRKAQLASARKRRGRGRKK